MSRKQQVKRPDNIAQTIKADNNNLYSAAIYKLDTAGNIKKDPYGIFLLNPSSIDDTKGANWVKNSIPGQSDPILQWVNSGARTVTFTALVTKDTSHFPDASKDLFSTMFSAVGAAVGSIASAFAGVNIPPVGDILGSLLGTASAGEALSIADYLDYYRSFCYPQISFDNELIASPPLLVLAMGKTLSALRDATGPLSPKDLDVWVCDNVATKITKLLPNLTPMEAEVTFTLTQYVIESRGSDSFGVKLESTPPSNKIAIPGTSIGI